MVKRLLSIFGVSLLSLSLVFSGCTTAKSPAKKQPKPAAKQQITLNLFGAGTLATPVKKINTAFQAKYPNTKINAQFGGSVKMVKQVTELHQPADIVAVADYSVIPKYMFGNNRQKKYTDWYIGFATNGITFVYTDKSKGAKEINSSNWYQVLARPGIQIGRSNPDTDPSGYQTLQMLNLAEKYYKKPGLAQSILKNAPSKNMRDTETELLSALKAGQIDYLAIYRSDAKQHNLKYLDLPKEIDLSDTKFSNAYKQVSVKTKNGSLSGKPIIYAVTIPSTAAQADWAKKFISFLLGSDGRAIFKQNGFGLLEKSLANDPAKVPTELKNTVTKWPK